MMQVLGVTDDGGRLPKYVGGRIICIHIYMCVCVCVCVCAVCASSWLFNKIGILCCKK